MKAFKKLKLKPLNKEPSIWFRRIVLFERIDPAIDIIRDIPLQQGLNIVWADEPGSDDPEAEITGHSAGKTGFCRLIRYLLGENTFGTKANTNFIRKGLRSGYVGAEMFVNGKLRSVIRPIGAGKASYTKENCDLEQLIAERGYAVYQEDYLGAVGLLEILNEIKTKEIVQTGEPIQWGHLLAWITRDQEARFQNIYEWRSPRSESDTPSFQFPKAGPLFMMRAVLGLITADELEAEENLSGLIRRQKDLEKEIAELQKEPQFRVNLYDRQLRSRLFDLGVKNAIDSEVDFDSDGLLPGLNKLTSEVREQLEGELEKLGEEEEETQTAISDINIKIGGFEKELEQLDSLFGLDDTASNELDAGLNSRRRVRGLQQKHKDGKCELAGILYKDCDYIKQRRGSLQLAELKDSRSMEQEEARRDNAKKEYEESIQGIEGKVVDLETELAGLKEKRNDLQGTIRSKEHQLSELNRVHSSLVEWRDRQADLDGFEELAKLKDELNDNLEEAAGLESSLNELVGAHEDRRKLLNDIFSAAVRTVLPSGTYDGKVKLDERELEYLITHGPAMSGEAVETLSVLLSDITNLTYSTVSAQAHLPGFLLHDSPREADLGIRIYWSFIRFVSALRDHLGKKNTCPFQYILTTTTAPPPELTGEDFVKLPLNAAEEDGLLYRRELSSAATAADDKGDNPDQSEFEI